MIIAFIFILAAFAWLMIETRCLTIRLESTEYQRIRLAQSKVKAKSDLPEVDRVPYKPSEFTPLAMPEISGKLNIVCQME